MEKIIHTKTLIIGAGMSGIGAAINLLKNNYEDFLVYDALERIGGRVCTETNDEGYLEIGAQWIHGQEGNVLYEIARDNGLVKEGFEVLLEKLGQANFNVTADNLDFSQLNKENLLQKIEVDKVEEKTVFATQTGQKILPGLAKSVYETITTIISAGEKAKFDERTASSDYRVGEFIYQNFSATVERQLAKMSDQLVDKAELRRVLNGLFLMRARRENIRSGCSNLFDLSLKNFSAYKEMGGHSYVELKHGYRPIIDVIIAPYKAKFYARVNLNHFVKKIYLCQSLDRTQATFGKACTHCKYTADPNKAVVKLCNATDQEKPVDLTVVCDNVLSTMSLGYLKENFNNVVDPLSLMSNERRLSVMRLGFGTINKIFLFYDKPFWSKNLELINMIWVPEDNNFHLDKMLYRNSTKNVWYEGICKFEVVNSYPNALSGWIAGNEEFEKLDDAAIAAECTRLLRQFLGNNSIPEPMSIKRTKWNSNRYTKGSYSHLPLGSNPSDLANLSKPIPSEKEPIVMFAGEATHIDFFSTTHGAYMSGVRESNRILRLNKKSPKSPPKSVKSKM